jgi:hypothetical protein
MVLSWSWAARYSIDAIGHCIAPAACISVAYRFVAQVALDAVANARRRIQKVQFFKGIPHKPALESRSGAMASWN